MSKEFFSAHFFPEGHGLLLRLATSTAYYLAALLFNAFPLPQREAGARQTLRYMGEVVEDGFSVLIPCCREATMGSGHLPVSECLQRIRAEYQEMPGLSLSKEQMQKMWGLDALVCDALVDALVAARILRRTPGGAYVVHGAGV